MTESQYSANDVFELNIKYLWFNSPHKEYTVTVYSKQDLTVRDDTGSVSKKYMNGTSPSGFTDSSYTGMDPSDTSGSTDTTDTTLDQNAAVNVALDLMVAGAQVYGDDNIEIKSFLDILNKAENEAHFWRLFEKNWWIIFVWFHIE